jgi:hypothetical protein
VGGAIVPIADGKPAAGRDNAVGWVDIGKSDFTVKHYFEKFVTLR